MKRHIKILTLALLLGPAPGLFSGCALLRQEFSAFQPTKAEPAIKTVESAATPAAIPAGIKSMPAEAPSSSISPEMARNGALPLIPPIPDLAPNLSDQQGIALDLEQVELRQVLELLADRLGINLVIDPAITDKITIRTAPGQTLQANDLWPLLRMLLANAGASLEKQGDIHHVRKNPNPAPAALGLAGDLLPGSGTPALQITPLRHVNAAAAINILKPLLEHNGRVIQIENLNILGIVASPAVLERVNSLIALLDADPFKAKGIRLFRLRHTAAQEMATELEKIFKLIAGEQSAYRLIPLERHNALLVVVPPETGFKEIERWVALLDANNQESNEQIFIYKVRNLKAESLAQTLSKSFPEPVSSGRVAKESPIAFGNLPAAGKSPAVSGSATAAAAGSPGSTAATASAPGADLRLKIVADPDTNSLLIRATPRDYRQLLDSILALDQVPKQVMINVVIAEVTLTESTRFGVEWRLLAENGKLSVHNVIGIGGLLADSSGARGLVVSNVGGELTSLLNFLGQQTDLKVLSRPSILVRNNQEAEIKVGSEEPILTSVINSSETIAGSTQLRQDVQYRDTGIILRVTPQINEDDIINLTVEQEVSQLGEDRTAYKLPSFTNRKVKTSAVVRDQSAMVLGGIIQSRLQNGKTGIPGLMEIPLLGLLFSDTTVSEVRTELVLIIAPELINPAGDQAANWSREFVDRLQAIKKFLDQESYVPF